MLLLLYDQVRPSRISKDKFGTLARVTLVCVEIFGLIITLSHASFFVKFALEFTRPKTSAAQGL
ncbi:hypothetical protein Bca52824_017079 [Brassica carinata]|uniref:Uncharacterized protein n=1 Tax=Brassica carinata TaxID=52824 RepID=A0A8X8AWX1_BRACI|nr:hypothetical protein Bca52824_017079 [Brassica carinata]